ncbi:uncharacterized protein MELLADRAFT_109118 [Melampsora larici-populina 98AG31]|uniref:Uncharacterized protein n=1 Tax=Melampsora larici-populina (strain 98AG31 / pathotype 3-4-7) TaxID=747676 RepID=F4RVD3_MELLP|nr:uncharacterized protein MELLADRAFT_109118 [Melampsora larici-populina 98AG31]EGG03689.1 hypothetical protein MELLADRAFT_109118 [Melampsora larici-populina 98AG31]
MPKSKNLNPSHGSSSRNVTSSCPEPHSSQLDSMPRKLPRNCESNPQAIPQPTQPHPFFRHTMPAIKFTDRSMGLISDGLNVSQPSDSHQLIQNLPSAPLPLPKFSDSSLEDFFHPRLKSTLGKSAQVEKDQEEEINGFLNDEDSVNDHFYLEILTKSSRKLDERLNENECKVIYIL